MSITIYVHHVIHDPDGMAAGPPDDLGEKLQALGHDYSETWYRSPDMSCALLIMEFATSQDVLAHFTALKESGFEEMALGKIFDITSADIVGDIDGEARAFMATYDFVNFMSPMSTP